MAEDISFEQVKAVADRISEEHEKLIAEMKKVVDSVPGGGLTSEEELGIARAVYARLRGEAKKLEGRFRNLDRIERVIRITQLVKKLIEESKPDGQITPTDPTP